MKNYSFIFSIVVYLSVFIILASCQKEAELRISLEKKYILEGDGKTDFYEPGGVAVDEEGNIYIADSGNQRVLKFSDEGEFIKNFGRKGQGPGEFQCPWLLEIYDGEIFVYDWNRNIQKFTLNGEYLSGFKLKGGIYLDFVMDSKGCIYLGRLTSRKGNFLIEKFDSEGSEIIKFCEMIEPPTRPLVLIYNNSKLCVDGHDNIYIAFRYINKIRKYNSDGILLREFARDLTYNPIKPEHTPDDKKPFNLDGITGDIFCDKHNRVFVISNKIWNDNGHLIEVLGEEGMVLGNFYSGYLGGKLPSYSELPRDQNLYIDGNQNFYIVDLGSMKVQVSKLILD